jgi:DNA-binding beta-propeller fold protein YncE
MRGKGTSMSNQGMKVCPCIAFIALFIAFCMASASAQTPGPAGGRPNQLARDCDAAPSQTEFAEYGCAYAELTGNSPMMLPLIAMPFRPEEHASASPMKLDTGYKLIKEVRVPGEGGWDYISVDSEARRIYVSHGDQIQVLNADSGKLAGQIPAPGAHGVALAPDLHRGFTSNGKDKTVTVFDTKTLAVIKTVKLEGGTDAILYDPFTKRVFPMNEKITVINAETADVAGTVDLGGDPEAAVSDGKGTVYVNLADKGAVAVIDPKGLSVTKTYPIEHCTSPHSLSFDSDTQRLFVGCRDGFSALDATTGKVVGTSLMCTGVDSGGFDPDNKLIFESCGEGVISVIREFTPDNYRIIETIPTKLWARTMAFDPKTKRIYLPTADFEFIPDSDPKKAPQRRWKEGSFTVLVVGKR